MNPLRANYQFYALLLMRLGVKRLNIYPIDPWRENKHGLHIHPDDAHLQYGPLSSVMLEWALAPSFSSTSALRAANADWHAARHYWLAARFPTDIDGGTPDSYSMTETECRILALLVLESLADEGL